MKKIMKYVLIGVGALIVINILVRLFADKDKKNDSASKQQKSITDSTKTESPKSEPDNWRYSEDVDKMTSEKRYYATCVSTNEVKFDFPYEGGSYLTFTIRNMNKENNVMVSISKGQFMTSIMGSKSCRVKFDNNKPINFTYTSPSDGSTDVVFIENASRFINLLKHSKKVIFEIEFFTSGNRLFDFDVEGFKWNK